MVQKAIKAQQPKKKKKPSQKLVIYRSIAETLQANSSGEFDLPSVLVQYNDRNHPKYRLGLHREMYIPSDHVAFYDALSERGMRIFMNQASIVIGAMVGEGIPIREKKFNLPLCEDCRED